MRIPSSAFKALQVAIVAGCLFLLLPAAPSHAQVIEWIDVPPRGNIPASVEFIPAFVGSNTIARNGNQITFDAIIDGHYIRYSGNCQSEMLYRLKVGSLDRDIQPQNVMPYSNERWFLANDYQSSILTVACEASR